MVIHLFPLPTPPHVTWQATQACFLMGGRGELAQQGMLTLERGLIVFVVRCVVFH